jgi:soluble cytochrome b562
MSDADEAYQAAERRIADAQERGDTRLDFSGAAFRTLDRLPPGIGTLDRLELLNLARTQVADIAPLQGLGNLLWLDLDRTRVANITPLQGLENLQALDLDGTQVADLRPIADLPRLGDRPRGLRFADTPAARATPELTRLSQIQATRQRTHETQADLKTLPPWPEPLPWEKTQAAASPSPEPATVSPAHAAPDGPPPYGLPRRITAGRARQVLETHSTDLREQCQFVTAQINDTLAQQIPAKPNDPEQLEAWTHLVNTLELARAAVTSLQAAVPEQTNDRRVTDDEANRLKQAFETAIAKLQEASAHIDGAGEAHGRTCAGLLKIGVCSAVAAPIALISAQPMALVGSGLYAMLYGKGAALDVVKAIGAAASPESDKSS